MKKTTIIFLLLVGAIPCMSQTDTTMKRFADSVCSCMSRLDLGKIKNQNDAQVAMVKCFTEGNMGLLLKVAQERNVDISDEAAMQKIGQEVGVILLQQGCEPFLKFSMKFAGKDAAGGQPDHPYVSGTLAAIETKEFSHFIITDKNGKKHMLYWIHQFDNADKFISQPSKYIGKKITAMYEETKVYNPATKSYVTIKELYGIEIL